MASAGAQSSLDIICTRYIAARVTPGLALAFGSPRYGQRKVAFGHLAYDGRTSVTSKTVYDLASLTKAIGTSALYMTLFDDATLVAEDLDHLPLAGLVPGIAPGVTLRHLLGHSSGYPAHIKFYEALADFDHPRSSLLRSALATPLEFAPGAKALYSDLGYIILGALLEAFTGTPLNQLFAARIASPLGLTSCSFVDLQAPEQPLSRVSVAPTEVAEGRGLIVGQVHDDNAYFAGGVCGHAGLFASAGEVARFGQAMISGWHGRESIFSQAVIRRFMGESAAPNSSWRLGWDTPSPAPGDSHAGDQWPRYAAVGHLGFTGCSLWLALEHEAYAVILSNRVHPTRDNQGIRQLRREVMDWIARALGVVISEH